MKTPFPFTFPGIFLLVVVFCCCFFFWGGGGEERERERERERGHYSPWKPPFPWISIEFISLLSS